MRSTISIAKHLSHITEKTYPYFSKYCNELEIGLRKNAILTLDKFLEISESWTFNHKAKFCTVLLIQLENIDDYNFILTTKLSEKIIKPTLIEMTVKEPNNFEPFKWYGYFYNETSFLKKAFELNQNDFTIKLFLLKQLGKDLWVSTHHLPDGYLGDIKKDVEDIALAFQIISASENAFDNYKSIFADYQLEIKRHLSTQG